MRRSSTGTDTPARVSVRIMSSSWILPSSGASSPDMRLINVVFPQPDRPNSATTPGVGASNSASRVKPSRLLIAATRSILTSQEPPYAARQQLGCQQAQQPQDQRQHRKPEGDRVSVR